MSNVYRYPNLTDEEKKAHNKRHHRVRRAYYEQRSVEHIAVLAYMRGHPERVEEIRRKHNDINTTTDRENGEGEGGSERKAEGETAPILPRT